MNTKINEILQEIESVIVGKNEIVEKILMAILAQGHVLMEDVPGVGKTTTAMAFAKVLGLETRRVQFMMICGSWTMTMCTASCKVTGLSKCRK